MILLFTLNSNSRFFLVHLFDRGPECFRSSWSEAVQLELMKSRLALFSSLRTVLLNFLYSFKWIWWLVLLALPFVCLFVCFCTASFFFRDACIFFQTRERFLLLEDILEGTYLSTTSLILVSNSSHLTWTVELANVAMNSWKTLDTNLCQKKA